MLKLDAHIGTKRHVIWDWNGTLLSDLQLAVDVVNRLLTEEGLPLTSVERYKQEFRFPVLEYYREIGFSTDPERFKDLCARFNAHFAAGLDTCALWPGAQALLTNIKAAGRTQSLLSLTEHTRLLAAVTKFELDHLFDHIVGHVDQMAGSKIDRGRELMSRANVSRADTVLVGDTDHDWEVGEALGLDVILVDHGHQCPTRLRKVHHRVVNVLD